MNNTTLSKEQMLKLNAPAVTPDVQRIKGLCKSKGISLTYLCQQMGCASSYFGDVKLGKTKVPRWRMDKMCDILNTTYEYLLDITENPSPDSTTRIVTRASVQALLDVTSGWAGREDEEECYQLLIAIAKKI